ncbi:MAG: DUF1987 domain-containing protein [Luteibaculaceae bacterium]
MEIIKRDATDETPALILDATAGKFEISGKSLPEDVTAFYGPVLEWLEAYAESPLEKTVFEFKMDYFNTASSKMILDILVKLEEIKEEGNEVLVKWHYDEDDEDMQEAGEEYSEIVEIEFELIAK